MLQKRKKASRTGLLVLSLITFVIVAGFIFPPQPKLFNYKLTQEETDMVLYGLDNSDLDHSKV